MDDSCSELREFRVEIPSREIVRCSRQSYERLKRAVGLLPSDLWWGQAYDRDVVVASGKAHPLVVAGLMALAHGHDIDVISEKIEALK